MKSTVNEIRQRFDADVERFASLETVQSATVDAPVAMVAQATAATIPNHALDLGWGCIGPFPSGAWERGKKGRSGRVLFSLASLASAAASRCSVSRLTKIVLMATSNVVQCRLNSEGCRWTIRRHSLVPTTPSWKLRFLCHSGRRLLPSAS